MTDVMRGHRTLPHTADLIVEAWGDDFTACAEEAAAAMLEICVAGGPADHATVVRVAADGTRPLLAAILDEVVYLLDISELVPVDVRLTELPGGVVEMRFGLGARRSVRLTGAAPKAVVMLEAPDERRTGPFRCRFIVDV